LTTTHTEISLSLQVWLVLHLSLLCASIRGKSSHMITLKLSLPSADLSPAAARV